MILCSIVDLIYFPSHFRPGTGVREGSSTFQFIYVCKWKEHSFPYTMSSNNLLHRFLSFAIFGALFSSFFFFLLFFFTLLFNSTLILISREFCWFFFLYGSRSCAAEFSILCAAYFLNGFGEAYLNEMHCIKVTESLLILKWNVKAFLFEFKIMFETRV